jgi:hypothetical protein
VTTPRFLGSHRSASPPGGRARTRRHGALFAGALATAGLVGVALPASSAQAAAGHAYVGPFTQVSTVASTVPGNGDVNPYGVAVVPQTMGALVAGDVLVSNFNNAANLQGTGSTIVEISPSGTRTVFAHIRLDNADRSLGGLGLTTALVVLHNGWVVVGDLPTQDGTAATAQAGGLIVLNDEGKVVTTITGSPINGPWDMTAVSHGGAAQLFVTNVLNGTVAANGAVVHKGTVVRVGITTPAQSRGIPKVTSEVTIGSGFAEETNATALVIGPTGVGLARDGTLYVADTLANRVTAISDAVSRTTSAGTGTVLTRHGALKGPLGLAVAPNGDVLTVNSGDGNLVDTDAAGTQAAVRMLDTSGSPPGSGALFGLAVVPGHGGVYFVNDATNTLDLLGAPTTAHVAGHAAGHAPGHRP